MEPALKTRLIGAVVLIAIIVIVVPMFFSGQSPQTDNGKTVSLALPASPDQELTTRTMSVAQPPAASSVAASASTATSGSDHLATVNLPSRVPPEVHPENSRQPAAGTGGQQQKPPPQPAGKPRTVVAKAKPAKAAPKPATPKPAAPPQPGRAARNAYLVNLGAYSDSGNVQDLVRRVRALGYAAHVDKVVAGGRTMARVSAGPFSTRTAAETARLRLKQSIPSAPATLIASTVDQQGDAQAGALPAGRAGGWAVQVGAYSHESDALAIRDKLRKAGFDGYVDSVQSRGRTLWRVRVGPQTQRADAAKIRDEVKARLNLAGVVVTVP